MKINGKRVIKNTLYLYILTFAKLIFPIILDIKSISAGMNNLYDASAVNINKSI